jgi:DNA-binding transcriptional regulator YhcF (GntR family)
MQEIGVSVNTLQKAKKELVDNGYLIIHRLSSANRYTIKTTQNFSKQGVKIWVLRLPKKWVPFRE